MQQQIVFATGEYAAVHDGGKTAPRARAGTCPPAGAPGPDRAAASAPVIHRQQQPQPQSQTTPATDKDLRDFVQATIDQFHSAATFFGDPIVTVDAARFERVINGWYAMVVDREKMIKDQLGGDPLLERELQTAYIDAIRVLMTRGAQALGKSEDVLYRENSGRIPMWAWQTPHRQESTISTPLEQGQAIDPLSGTVAFTSNAIQVTILPDGTDPTLTAGGQTRLNLPFNVPYLMTTTRGVKKSQASRRRTCRDDSNILSSRCEPVRAIRIRSRHDPRGYRRRQGRPGEHIHSLARRFARARFSGISQGQPIPGLHGLGRDDRDGVPSCDRRLQTCPPSIHRSGVGVLLQAHTLRRHHDRPVQSSRRAAPGATVTLKCAHP